MRQCAKLSLVPDCSDAIGVEAVGDQVYASTVGVLWRTVGSRGKLVWGHRNLPLKRGLLAETAKVLVFSENSD